MESELISRLGILSSAPKSAAQPRDQSDKQGHLWLLSDRELPHSARSTRIGSTRMAVHAGAAAGREDRDKDGSRRTDEYRRVG